MSKIQILVFDKQKRQLIMNQRFKFLSVKDGMAFVKDKRHYLLNSAEKLT